MEPVVRDAARLLLTASACACIVLSLTTAQPRAARAAPAHAIAMQGAPHYPPDFTHFAYADPSAPKGGKLELAVEGSFDSTNPMIIKGDPVTGAPGFVFETLMTRALDEPFSLYGLLAESIETPDDRSWVSFVLRPEARFSDGRPVTVDDVVFSLELLRDHGRPNHRDFYSKVVKTERMGERGIKFIFKDASNRELPLNIGLMPVLPKHLFNPVTFEQPTLAPLVGSGPYVMHKVDPGRSITYRRNPDYWGANLAPNRGRFNFEQVTFQYYRDKNALFEGFKAGAIDVQVEGDPSKWADFLPSPAD
jgi:peptide/nickel transport system substrate-binding protein